MIARISLVAALLVTTAPLAAQEAPIVLPGAPGAEPRVIDAAEAIALSDTRFSPADVSFMQGMIVHHQQAVDMAKLVRQRTNNEAVLKTADRIEAGQKDEMDFMRTWLEDRNLDVAMQGMGHAHHTMKGMASPEQMRELAAANGTAFDRLFLELMVAHHLGAVDMVDELHGVSGSAYDPVMYEFTNDVVSDQRSEIDRMNATLATLSTDPRATLKPGFRDAGEAISNMRHVVALQKPAGFFDPENPAQLQPIKERDKSKDEAKNTSRRDGDEEEDEPQFGERGSLLSFAFTDMAFSGDMMVAGSYHGFNTYRLGQDGVPQLISSVVCPGGQGDVSIAGNLLVMSVEDRRGRIDCGLEGVDDGDVLAVDLTGHDRAGVEEDAGQVQAGGGHQHAGQRLVAARQQHRAVEALGVHHDLDGVGDDLAGDQREVHALVAHRDAVGDRDRAELQGVALCRVHAVLHGLGQPVEREVAGRDLVPAGRDADLGLLPVLVAHAYGTQHPSRRGPLETVGHVAGAGLEVRGAVGSGHGGKPTCDGSHAFATSQPSGCAGAPRSPSLFG